MDLVKVAVLSNAFQDATDDVKVVKDRQKDLQDTLEMREDSKFWRTCDGVPKVC